MEESREALSHLSNRVSLPEHATPADEATALHIPEAYRSRPEVQAFCGVAAEAENLMHHLDTLAAGGNVDRDVQPELRQVFGDPDRTQDLTERYAAGELILRGVIALLKQGMQDTDETSDQAAGYAVSKIDAALRSYGYTVVKTDGSQQT